MGEVWRRLSRAIGDFVQTTGVLIMSAGLVLLVGVAIFLPLAILAVGFVILMAPVWLGLLIAVGPTRLRQIYRQSREGERDD